MPATPSDHFSYTINEWGSDLFKKITDKLPKRLDVIYDIGANSGGFTKVMKDKYKLANIYCFEPLQRNFDELKLNTPYATHFKVGIFYGMDNAKLFERGGNIGAVFLEHVESGEPREYTGESVHLSELENLPILKPDLIKMDVEGAEVNIIQHSPYVKECKWLIIEWHPNVNPINFFNEHLKKHEIVVNLEGKQFLLCLKD